jgi:recombination DNA repair RAD52 pathway protein
MTITDEQRRMLDEDLPASAVAQRTQAGVTLSYVQGWWVIGEMNRIFPGGWSYEVDTAECYRAEEPSERGTRWRVTYRARCVLRVGDVVIADVGHGHGIDRQLGLAIESAEKEAATDALKRAAKSLGWRLGLALYDRTQEHVADDTAPQPQAQRASEADERRVLEAWDAMSDQEKRAVWPTLSAGTKDMLRAAKAAKGVR